MKIKKHNKQNTLKKAQIEEVFKEYNESIMKNRMKITDPSILGIYEDYNCSGKREKEIHGD